MKKSVLSKVAIGGGVAFALVAGGWAGSAAVAGIPTLLSPVGVSSNSATGTLPDPEWKENAAGETFGSLQQSNSPENEPDLIQAVATNGREGYVRASELAAASGTDREFRSPEEALQWQATEGAKSTTVRVYEVDGKTVIGDFDVLGAIDSLK